MSSVPARLLVPLLLGLFVLACSGLLPMPLYKSTKGRFIHAIPPGRAAAALDDVAPRRPGEPHRITKLSGFDGSSLIQDPELDRFLRRLKTRLLAGYPHPTPEIGMFATSELPYNARATPGGDVLVNMGLLRDAESEDEVAFAVAHELGHILLDHFERDDVVEAEKKAATLAAGTAVAALLLGEASAAEGPQGTQLQVEASGELGEKLAHVAFGYLALQELVETVFEPAWKRKQESEADLLALDLVTRAGYHPTAANDTLDHFLASEEEQAKLRTQKLKEHASSYASALVAAARTQSADQVKQVLSVIAIDASVRLARFARDTLKTRHHGVERRRKNIAGYYRREYQAGLEEVPDVQRRLPDLVRRGRLKQVFEHHELAHEAWASLEDGRLREAAQLGLRSISYPTARAPFPRYVMYQIRKRQGRRESALANLLRVTRSPGTSPNLYISLAEEYNHRSRFEDALNVLDGAEELVETEEPFLPLRIRVARSAGLEPILVSALERCRDAEDDDLMEQCHKEAGPRADVAAGGGTGLPDLGGIGTSMTDAVRGLFGNAGR